MTTGQTFHWKSLDNTKQGVAVVVDISSDQEEGMSPEVEQYAARWMDARALYGDSSGEPLRFLLGTDERVYLGGQQVVLSPVEDEQPS